MIIDRRCSSGTEPGRVATAAVYAVAVALTMVACGQPVATQRTSEGSASEAAETPEGWVALPDGSFCGPPEPVPLGHNWLDPPSGRVLVASVQDSATHLAFTPNEPKGLGLPKWVTVSPDIDAKEIRTLWIRYDSEPYGNVHINMWLDPVPVATRVASWQEDAAKALAGDPCFHGTAEMVVIRGTTQAIIGGPADEDRVSINWREGPLWVQVGGPALQRDDAIAIAEKL